MKLKPEEFILEEGMRVDINEGWKKITSRQFGGNAGRASLELIQNMIDSYPDYVPWEERRGDIITNSYTNYFSVTDYGSGFTREKLKLILTLGGTDKADNESKIGRFGIGFFSIFSKSLGTRRVVVTTTCEGFTIEVAFLITSPDSIPHISMKVISKEIAFSTRIEVFFDNPTAPNDCLSSIINTLKYYPCQFTVNGTSFQSVWEQARINHSVIFNRDYCNGTISKTFSGNWVTVLCKYEYIISLSLNSLITGSGKPTYDLDDYRETGFPFVPEREILVNCNHLSLTISRDSFYLDFHYQRMKENIRQELFGILLSENIDKQLMLANLYIFQDMVASFVKNGEHDQGISEPLKRLIEKLANAELFEITGSTFGYSIIELKKKLTVGLPLFYSPNKENNFWLGRRFKHDFILLPQRCHLVSGANHFYNRLLTTIFDDVVNLDEIQGNNKMIKKLVERGIVDEKSLALTIDFVGEKKNSNLENTFLEEINILLKNEEIVKTIEDNLYLRIRSIRAMFFMIEEEGAYISTGIFDQKQNPLNDSFFTNFYKKENDKETLPVHRNDLLLGLRKNHPLIRQLVHSENRQRAYFALSYIAHELAYCQKLLVPHSLFYHITREKLANDMRQAMMVKLIKEVA
jgi:hypothetical protein